jgi:molecular chaperone DnaJ
MPTDKDYYELLGVGRDAGEAEIKRSFRRLARELHPDVSDEDDAQERFREVAEADEVLSDPERRRTYDRYGHAGLRGGGFHPTEFDLGNLSDVFSAFFGEGLFGGGGGGGRARGPARGADLAVGVEITLADALTGTSVEVPIRVARSCETCEGTGAAEGTEPITCQNCRGAGRVQQVSQSIFGQVVRAGTCPRCEGSGRIVESPCATCDSAGRVVEDASLDIDIPAGIHDGQRIRVRGEGHAGESGASAGDAYVHVHVAAMDGVVRDGDDLVTVAEITMTQAALGATVSVPTPEGPFTVDLEPGTQPGEVHRVRGRGMPSLEQRRRGDLLVHVGVRIPHRLTDEQRASLERVAEELDDEAYRADVEEEGFFSRLRGAFR